MRTHRLQCYYIRFLLPATWEAETEGSRVQNQPGLYHKDSLFQNKQINKQNFIRLFEMKIFLTWGICSNTGESLACPSCSESLLEFGIIVTPGSDTHTPGHFFTNLLLDFCSKMREERKGERSPEASHTWRKNSLEWFPLQLLNRVPALTRTIQT